MAQKNDTPAIIGALVLTLALIGGGIWWFSSRTGGGLDNMLPGGSETSGTGTAPGTTAPGTTAPGTTAPPTGQPGAQTFAEVQNVPSGVFNYGGSTTWAPIRSQVDSVIQNAHPGFQLRYQNPLSGPPGSGAGIEMVLQGTLVFSQSSRSLKPEEYQAAQQRGFTLVEIPVAIEGIAIAVHPSLNVPGITIDQLRGIYTGQITNWSQVGGPNQPITPITRPTDGGTVEFFISNILGGGSFGGNVQQIPTTTEALRAVSADPGAIYYASAPEVVGQCTTKPLPIGQQPNQFVAPYVEPLVPPENCPAQRNQINNAVLQSGQYPITRRLFVIVKQNGQVDQQAGEAYTNLLLTNEGQMLLEQAGFVRIR
jgi:phosphate transport system substrate-binding protein